MDSVPFTVKLAVVIVFTPLPPMVTLLKVVAPVIVWAALLKITVPAFAVSVPLLLQFPLTVSEFEPDRVNVAPDPIVMLLQAAEDEITG